jgi:hypothetical protein
MSLLFFYFTIDLSSTVNGCGLLSAVALEAIQLCINAILTGLTDTCVGPSGIANKTFVALTKLIVVIQKDPPLGGIVENDKPFVSFGLGVKFVYVELPDL